MAKFKVGDKVRINDVDRIHYGDSFWMNGDVTEVMEVCDDGDILVKVTRGIFRGDVFPIAEREFDYIEKVAETPTKLTKSQRIEALEKQVAELKLEIVALKSSEIAGQIAKALREEKSKTPNQKRKAIIDEAKAFVEDVTKRMSQYGHGNKLGEHGEITTSARGWVTKAEFLVNAKKRTVVALARGIDSGNIYAKGIAKCAPDDVFNADIGKAIALGRALGLDVTRFEQAVQPTELVVGMVVEDIDDDFPIAHGKVAEIEPKDCQGQRGYWTDKRFYAYLTHAKILDDTEAQY